MNKEKEIQGRLEDLQTIVERQGWWRLLGMLFFGLKPNRTVEEFSPTAAIRTAESR